MILPLRRAHRALAVLLAVMLPMLFLISLAARPDAVVTTDWPDEVRAGPTESRR